MQALAGDAPACSLWGVLNNALTSLSLWTPRIVLAALLMTVEDPYRLAAATLVFTVQIPIQRAILAWDAQSRLRPVRVRA